MVSVFTTKANLEDIFQKEENIQWQLIILKLKEVFINDDPFSDCDESNPDDDVFLTLDGMGVKLNDDKKAFIDNIPNDPESVLRYPCGIFLLGIDRTQAESIQEDYGVICTPLQDNPIPSITENGWDVDTADTTINQSWDYFLSGIQVPLNAMVIVDRYFFSSEKNKSNYSLNETIEDSYNNLRQILDKLLPPRARDGLINVTIIYDHDTIHRDETIEFNRLVTAVNRVKRNIRPYAFTLELISLTSDCYQYKETHDRFIISNYFIVNATHKIKAYRLGNISLDNQRLFFDYLFSKGIKPNDKSSMPLTTQTRVLKALCESIATSKNIIQHGCNGQTSRIGEFSLNNRLLKIS